MAWVSGMLSNIKTQSAPADVVPLHKPASLDKLASHIRQCQNELVQHQATMQRLDAMYAEQKASIQSDIDTSENALAVAVQNYDERVNQLGIQTLVKPAGVEKK